MTQVRSTRSIVVERVLPHPPEKIWRTLTESALISEWLMPNDFESTLGKRFNLRATPIGDWDGVVECEVLEVKPLRLLRYSWNTGSFTGEMNGSRLESIVTWTLTPLDDGTRVRMEHAGFGPGNELAYDEMTSGWTKVVEWLNEVTIAAAG
jgi:uncharacterized protein YndB with AHSA1/START domain